MVEVGEEVGSELLRSLAGRDKATLAENDRLRSQVAMLCICVSVSLSLCLCVRACVFVCVCIRKRAGKK